MFWLAAASPDKPRLVIVHAADYADHLKRSYPSLFNRPEIRVMSVHALKSRGLVGIYRNTRVAVDNIDLVLPALIGLPVEIVTGCEEP